MQLWTAVAVTAALATDPVAAGAGSGAASAAETACFADLASPPGGTGEFSADGQTLYLLANLGTPLALVGPPAAGPAAKAAGASGRPSVRYALLKIQPKARTSTTVALLDHRHNASLVLTGEPAAGFSAVAFAKPAAPCFSGNAVIATRALDAPAAPGERRNASVQLVRTPTGLALVDTSSRAIAAAPAADPAARAAPARRVPPGERPLYFDPQTLALVVWHGPGKQRGLTWYPGDGTLGARRLPFAPRDRVLASGGRFAVARLDPARNAISIHEVEGWTGPAPAKAYELAVPAAYPVESAAMEIAFDRHTVLVFGATVDAKKRWQRVFVFNYATGELLGAVPVTGNAYLGYAGIDPTGAFAVVEVRDATTLQTLGARVFDIAKKTYADLPLDLPRR